MKNLFEEILFSPLHKSLGQSAYFGLLSSDSISIVDRDGSKIEKKRDTRRVCHWWCITPHAKYIKKLLALSSGCFVPNEHKNELKRNSQLLNYCDAETVSEGLCMHHIVMRQRLVGGCCTVAKITLKKRQQHSRQVKLNGKRIEPIAKSHIVDMKHTTTTFNNEKKSAWHDNN